jgi:EAL domain-containing protein (putative c-di-GMP-specific phosphodiesterase class I)
VLHPKFLNLISQCTFANKLVIELTEKSKWTKETIEILGYIQNNYNVQLAMDDVNPNVSNKNYSMKTLEKFSNNGVYIDI